MSTNPDCFISISRDQLPSAIKAAYRLSFPVGFGFLHFQEGELSDEDTEALLTQYDDRPNYPFCVSMDYVRGRCCKFSIRKHPTDGDVALIPAYWYDHTDRDLVELLTTCGVEDPMAAILTARQAMEEINGSPS